MKPVNGELWGRRVCANRMHNSQVLTCWNENHFCWFKSFAHLQLHIVTISYFFRLFIFCGAKKMQRSLHYSGRVRRHVHFIKFTNIILQMSGFNRFETVENIIHALVSRLAKINKTIYKFMHFLNIVSVFAMRENTNWILIFGGRLIGIYITTMQTESSVQLNELCCFGRRYSIY